jgi:molybdate transport system substrate-binding protein
MRSIHIKRNVLFLIFLVSTLSLISCQKKAPEKLTIAAAANMQFAVAELSKAFSEQSGIDCEIVVSSSGKLTAQVIEGAPFDLLLSADMKFPEELFRKGLTRTKPLTYAYGNLILWTLKEGVDPVLESLGEESIKHIALGNPKTAPYGTCAMQVLIRTGAEEKLKEKLVFGESISQTNQFIISKVADIGFTSKSVVMSPVMQEIGAWKEIDKDLYEPIEQGIVILNNRDTFQNEAIEFRDFLLSTEGKHILHKFGYETVK